MTVFLILTALTLFLSLAILIAGMVIFLIIHVFYEISMYQNSYLAYVALIALTLLFSYLIFFIAQKIFLRAIKKQEKKVEAGLFGFRMIKSFTSKAIIGVILLEVLRIFLRRFGHKSERRVSESK